MGERGHYEKIREGLLRSGKAPEICPARLEAKIHRQNDWLKEHIEDPVFTLLTTQDFQSYCQAYQVFFEGFEVLDQKLENRRFLLGDYVTDSDIRLYVTLARYDVQYAHDMSPCKGRLEDYQNLWAYARDLYQIPEFAKQTDFLEFAAENESEEEGLDKSTYFELVIPQSDLDTIWKMPAGREYLSQDPAHRFQSQTATERVQNIEKIRG